MSKVKEAFDLDPTLLSRLKALHEKALAARPNGYSFNSESCKWVAVEVQSLAPELLAHIEAQDKRVSAMVEALEAARAGLHSVCVFEAEERIDESDLGEIEIHHNTECKAASAALAALRKTNEL